MSHWTNRYIGIPHADFGYDVTGCNCWGLAVLIYAEQLGVVLPTYEGAYISLEEEREISSLIAGEKASPVWRPIVTANAAAFDVAIFRRGSVEQHLGIVVSPGLMLHVAAGEQSRIEHYTTGKWGHRLTGIHRHVDAILKVAS